MKIRNGFVSNSSSSSFIVNAYCMSENELVDLSNTIKKNGGKLVVDGSRGTTEFGWDQIKYEDFYSKLNFAYLQYLYVKDEHPEWLSVLEDALGDEIGVIDIEWGLQVDEYGKPGYGYIDHQSSSHEGSNMEIFDSMDKLKSFLFNEDSYIQGDNDNH